MDLTDPKAVARALAKDPKSRRAAARARHLLFTKVYLPDLIGYDMAKMHHDLYAFTQDPSLRLTVIMAFRGSGKSTILSTSYPMWAILGCQQKKFVVIVAQTQAQAKKILDSIRTELEGNARLQAEMGPFNTYGDEWSGTTVVLSKYNARILIASVEQSVRGIKHGAVRPDLVILDDVQDFDAVRTYEAREKAYKWFLGEILPLGDKNTKYILIGNKLHEESLVSRVAESIETGKREGKVGFYPIIGEKGRSQWPAKFPTLASIKAEERFIGDYATWQREYMQKIVAEADQIIRPEDIKHYDPHTQVFEGLRFAISSADLAASQKDQADKTAIITAKVCGWGSDLRFYLLPSMVNQRLSFPQIIPRLQGLVHGHGGKVVVETVATQQYVAQQLRDNGVAADEFKPQGDKRTRLYAISQLIATGRILFPKDGSQELEQQLIGFGSERHDDLVDALTMLVLHVLQEDSKGGSVRFGSHPVVSRKWREIERRMRIR